MAKGNIDPAFQAAPNLGASSYNPIEFARRQKLQKFQIQRKRDEEKAANIAKGLDDLMLDLKGWEDQDGFKEIMADQDRVLKGFLDISKKGLNLVSPRSTQELMAYKAINEEHAKIKQKVDTWQQQKSIYDLYTKAIEQDSLLPSDQQKINKEATMANIQKVLKSKGIIERGTGLQNLIVTNPDKVDLIKEITSKKGFYEQPTQTQVIVPNPETGQSEIQLVEQLTPDQEKENVRRAGIHYEELDPSYKDAVTKLRESDLDPRFNVMSNRDYFATIAVPQYKEKFLQKPTGSGGGGINFNFLGAQAKITPGEHQTNDRKYADRNYNDRYDITSTKPFTVPINEAEYFGGEKRILEGGRETGGWKPITEGGGDVEAVMLFYDPNTDVIMFRLTQDSRYPYLKNNTTISVPRKNLAKADDLPIRLPNGKVGTLKDIAGTKSSAGLRMIGGEDFSIPSLIKKRK